MNEVKDTEVVGDDIEKVILYNNNTIAEEKEEEKENWIANDVFDSVDNVAQRYMLVRWAITEKVKGGFEENTSDNTIRKK